MIKNLVLKQNYYKLLIVVLSAFFIFACGEKKDNKKNKQDVPSYTILKINGVDVKNSELLDYSYFIVQEMDPLALENEEVKERIIKNFVTHRLLIEEVHKRELDVTDERVAKIVEYLEQVEEGRADEDSVSIDEEAKNKLKKQMIENILVQKLLTTVADTDIRVADAELKAYYDANKGKFSESRKANVFMILTADEVKANAAMAELKNGVPFAEVAEKFSISDEGRYGGNLGFISAEDYPDAFAEAFKLKVGATSDIIKSEYGYHIFKTTAYKNSENKKFEQVKAEIYTILYSEKQEKSVRNFIDEIYNKAEIINVAPISFEPITAGASTDN